MKKLARLVVLVTLVVTALGLYSVVPAHARAMCTLIDMNAPAQPNDGGEGMGTTWTGYLAAGTVVQYAIDYSGEAGGGGIGIWSGSISDPRASGPPDVYGNEGPTPLNGSYTITSSGNYTIDAGAGSESVQEAMVSVLVQATCQGKGVDLTCTQLAQASGPPAGGSAPAFIAAGTLVTITAEASNPECPVEGNLHVGDCSGPLLTQARGIGFGESSILISESGTYEFCIGGMPDWADSACLETTITVTGYAGCSTVGAAGCPLNMNITESAVVGTVVTDTPLFWTPGQALYPAVMLEKGKTAWVLGIDDTGAYYKIIWVCDYLWVPVEAMGPTYDNNWNGAALPTGTVY